MMKRISFLIAMLLWTISAHANSGSNGDFFVSHAQNYIAFGGFNVVTGQQVTATITITNAPAGLTNQSLSFSINGGQSFQTFLWTTTVITAGQVAITNSAAQAATNLYTALTNVGIGFAPYLKSYYATQTVAGISLVTSNGYSLLVSNNWQGWATFSAVTNAGGTNAVSTGSSGGTTNLATILAAGPNAGNMASQVISNGILTNVTIQALTLQGNFSLTNLATLVANGVFSNGGFNVISGTTTSPVVNGGSVNLTAMTNGLAFASGLHTQTLVYASDYFTNDATTDNTGGLTNLINATKNGPTTLIGFAPTNSILIGKWPSNTQFLVSLGSNSRAYWNGMVLNFTNVTSFANAAPFDCNGISNVAWYDLTVQRPVIPTNDVVPFQDGGVWLMRGVCSDLRFDWIHVSGGRFGWLTGGGGGSNYNIYIDHVWGNNIGNYAAQDGAISALGGNIFYSHIRTSNTLNGIEWFVPGGGQTNSVLIADDVECKDFQRAAFSSQLGMKGYSVTLKNWRLSEPSFGAGFHNVYNGTAGISIGTTVSFADLQNIIIDAPFNAQGFDVEADTNNVIDNFQCVSCTALTSVLGGSTAAIRASNIGSLTVNSGTTWNYYGLNAVSLTDNGTGSGQDLAGNVKEQGSLSVSGAGTFTGTITGQGTLAWLGALVGNNQVISNGGTLSSGQAGPPTNQIFFVDTSAGSFTNTQATSSWAINQIVGFFKTNSQNNPWYYKGSTASRVNTFNGQQFFVMSNQWDYVIFQKRADNVVNVIGGNNYSNLNVNTIWFNDGTKQTTAAQAGSLAQTNYTAGGVVTGATFTNGAVRETIYADMVIDSGAAGTAYGAIIDITAGLTNRAQSVTGIAFNQTQTLVLTVGPNDICIISNSAGTGATSTLTSLRGVQ